MRFFLFLLFIQSSLLCISQSANDYNWGEPSFELTEEERNLDGILLKDFRQIIFRQVRAPYISISKKTKTVHRKIFLNSDSLVSKYSNLILPISETDKIESFQYRILQESKPIQYFKITSSDTCLSIEKENVKVIFNGFSKGSILEYLYTIEVAPNAYGSEIIQSDLPAKEVVLTLVGNGLNFNVKGYNGAAIELSQNRLKRNIYKGEMWNVPAYKDELYAANEANKMRVDYTAREITWETLSEVIILNLFFIRRKIRKQIDVVLQKEIKIDQYGTTIGKIEAIENYIKSNFQYIKNNADEFTKVDEILVSKKANDNGFVYLFAAFLKQAKIDFETVATSDRYYKSFDRDFPSSSNLGYFMFYFSKEDKFLTPFPARYKFGVVPFYLLEQDAFSVSGKYSKGKGVSSIFRFLTIENEPTFKSEVTEAIDLHIYENDSPFISMQRTLSGYKALNFIKAYKDVDSTSKVDLINMQLPIDNALPKELKLNGKKNVVQDLQPEKAIVLYAALPEKQFVASNKDSLVIHIGKLMGEQIRLEDSIRTEEIIISYPLTYERVINIYIEDIANKVDIEKLKTELDRLRANYLDILNFEVILKIEKDKLIFQVSEKYNFIELDKKHYNVFRKVVNSAHEFSKMKLVIPTLN